MSSTLFHGFDYRKSFSATPKEKLSAIPLAMEHVLKQDNGKERFLKYSNELLKAFALAIPHEKALEIRDDVGFFQAVRSSIIKTTIVPGKPREELDTAIKQIVSKAIVAGDVIDILQAAGLKKPDLSILSPEFLAEVRGLPQKNLALELLRKLINDEIQTRLRINLIQGRSFSEMLEKTIKRYHSKSIETTQVIEELIELAKKVREAHLRGEELNLTRKNLHSTMR